MYEDDCNVSVKCIFPEEVELAKLKHTPCHHQNKSYLVVIPGNSHIGMTKLDSSVALFDTCN